MTRSQLVEETAADNAWSELLFPINQFVNLNLWNIHPLLTLR